MAKINKDSESSTTPEIIPGVNGGANDIDIMTEPPAPEVVSTEEVPPDQWFKITTKAKEYKSRSLPQAYCKGQPTYTKDLDMVKKLMVNGHFSVVKVSEEEATTVPIRPKSQIRPGSRRN
jgi:hypothetical protein